MLVAGPSSLERERPDVVVRARRVSRAFLCSLSRVPRAGVGNAIPMATPLGAPGPLGTPAGCGAGLGDPMPEPRAAAGIPTAAGETSWIARGAGTAGEVTLLLRKPKLLSWHVLRPEGVHPLPAQELGTLVGVRGGGEPGLELAHAPTGHAR